MFSIYSLCTRNMYVYNMRRLLTVYSKKNIKQSKKKTNPGEQGSLFRLSCFG